LPGAAPPPTNALVALVEVDTGDRARIALVSVVPNTGDIVYDEFDGKLQTLRLWS
jgi:DNA mismatch repair protein MSH3